MKETNLKTIQDYIDEYNNVTNRILQSNSETEIKQLSVYRRRIRSSIRQYDKNRGTHYCDTLIVKFKKADKKPKLNNASDKYIDICLNCTKLTCNRGCCELTRKSEKSHEEM